MKLSIFAPLSCVMLLWHAVEGQDSCELTAPQRRVVEANIRTTIVRGVNDAFDILEGPNCDRAYLFSKFQIDSWRDGQKICNGYGGYLAEMDSEEEHNHVAAFRFTRPQGDSAASCFWMGGTDAARERSWVSGNTGAALPFLRWQTAEPSRGRFDDCQAFCSRYTTQALEMDAIPCDRSRTRFPRRFICEVPYNVPPTVVQPPEGGIQC